MSKIRRDETEWQVFQRKAKKHLSFATIPSLCFECTTEYVKEIINYNWIQLNSVQHSQIFFSIICKLYIPLTSEEKQTPKCNCFLFSLSNTMYVRNNNRRTDYTFSAFSSIRGKRSLRISVFNWRWRNKRCLHHGLWFFQLCKQL